MAHYWNFQQTIALLPKHSTGNSKHSTKTKINFSTYLYKVSVVLGSSIGKAIVGWSVVFYRHSNTLLLCDPICDNCGTSHWTSPMTCLIPLAHIQTYPTIKVLKLVIFVFFSGPVKILLWLASIPTLQLPASQPLRSWRF